jgi:hypothetical protein
MGLPECIVIRIYNIMYSLPGDNKQHNNCEMAFLSFAHAIIINWRYCVRLSDRKSGAPRCSFWCPEPKSMQGTQLYTRLPLQTAVSTKGFPAGQRRFIYKYIYIYTHTRITYSSYITPLQCFCARMVIERFLQNGLYKPPPLLFIHPTSLYIIRT